MCDADDGDATGSGGVTTTLGEVEVEVKMCVSSDTIIISDGPVTHARGVRRSTGLIGLLPNAAFETLEILKASMGSNEPCRIKSARTYSGFHGPYGEFDGPASFVAVLTTNCPRVDACMIYGCARS